MIGRKINNGLWLNYQATARIFYHYPNFILLRSGDFLGDNDCLGDYMDILTVRALSSRSRASSGRPWAVRMRAWSFMYSDL